MPLNLAQMFAALVALIGPPPADAPKELQLQKGDQIVAIGNSITQGANNAGHTGYLDDINAVLAEKYPDLKLSKVINVGISGQKAEDLIKRFQKDVVDKGRNGSRFRLASMTFGTGSKTRTRPRCWLGG